MRIIGGKFKGKEIKAPDGIRPTQDMVRKALFDILGDMDDLSFLELYAGSGAIGLEALSRGAKAVVFLESSRQAARAIQANLESLKPAEGALAMEPGREALVINKDVSEVIPQLYKTHRLFDVIFLDPPYYKGTPPRLHSESMEPEKTESLTKKTLQTLGAYDILAPYGIIVIQHFKKDNLPDTAGDLILFKQSPYGDTLLSFFKKNAAKSDISR
jgi:16S rRNA (guanine(966)-N(2))-methyltransferase RsmD